MDKWQEQNILILGQTYPTYSRKYMETACTGGLLEGTSKMVRLYPIPDRYLQPDQQFRAFQWVRFRVTRNLSDPRPESYRIDPNSVTPLEKVTNHDDRRHYIGKSPHLASSV